MYVTSLAWFVTSLHYTGVIAFDLKSELKLYILWFWNAEWHWIVPSYSYYLKVTPAHVQYIYSKQVNKLDIVYVPRSGSSQHEEESNLFV